MKHLYEKPELVWSEIHMEGFLCGSATYDFKVQVDEYQTLDEEYIEF